MRHKAILTGRIWALSQCDRRKEKSAVSPGAWGCCSHQCVTLVGFPRSWVRRGSKCLSLKQTGTLWAVLRLSFQSQGREIGGGCEGPNSYCSDVFMAVSKICRSFMNFVSILTQLVLSSQPMHSPERTWHFSLGGEA